MTKIMESAQLQLHTYNNGWIKTGERRACKHFQNEDYFQEIDTQDKAYLLGLLYSDGWIRVIPGNCGGYSLGICSIDSEIPDTLKMCLEATNPIYEYQPKRGKLLYSITINSIKLVNSLISHGVLPNKSKIIQFPDSIDNDLIPHFIRGYFDGDGGVMIRKNPSPQLKVMFCGTENVMESIRSYLFKVTNKTPKLLPNSSIFKIEYGGNINCTKIYRYLYNDANLYLSRKRLVFDNSGLLKINFKPAILF